jgi:hypothetical protein
MSSEEASVLFAESEVLISKCVIRLIQSNGERGSGEELFPGATRLRAGSSGYHIAGCACSKFHIEESEEFAESAEFKKSQYALLGSLVLSN